MRRFTYQQLHIRNLRQTSGLLRAPHRHNIVNNTLCFYNCVHFSVFQKIFLPKKNLLLSPLFFFFFPLHFSQIPSYYLLGCIPKFLEARPETQPPTHHIFVGLRPSASGLHRQACRLSSGKGKGRGKKKKKGGENHIIYRPITTQTASGRQSQGARSSLPQTTYNFHFIIIIDCLL